MSKLESISYSRKELRKYLVKSFSLSEIRIILFDLDIDHENLSTDKSLLVVDLLEILIRDEKLNLLVNWLEEEGYGGVVGEIFQERNLTKVNHLLPSSERKRTFEEYERLEFILWKVQSLTKKANKSKSSNEIELLLNEIEGVINYF
ncbi:MAG: hypothetical protein AB8G95_12035 [Anaerolineae bacterium]